MTLGKRRQACIAFRSLQIMINIRGSYFLRNVNIIIIACINILQRSAMYVL